MDFDDDFCDDYDQNYFYVEDSYDTADDLAEHACPSPQPYAYDYEWDELSRFDYWVDIEYDSDGYDDIERRRQRESSSSPTKVRVGQKRKSSAALTAKDKRRKLLDNSAYLKTVAEREDKSQETIIWRTTEEKLREPSNTTMAAGLEVPNPVALLKDWKVRFANDHGFETAATDENEWSHASSLENEEVSPKSGKHGSGDDLNSLLAASGLNADTLRTALEASMAATGAAPYLNTDTLLKYAARMLGGADNVDDVAGELAEELLDDEGDEEEDSTFMEWVQRQKAQTQAESRKDSAVDIGDMNAPPSRAEEIEDEVTAYVHGHEPHKTKEDAKEINKEAVQRNSKAFVQPVDKKRKCADLGQDMPRKKEKKGYETPTTISRAKTRAVSMATRQEEAKAGGKK